MAWTPETPQINELHARLADAERTVDWFRNEKAALRGEIQDLYRSIEIQNAQHILDLQEIERLRAALETICDNYRLDMAWHVAHAALTHD